jgi:hypothetical protein
VPDADITLGKLNRREQSNDPDAYAIRKQYYLQLTNTPYYEFNIPIVPRFLQVHQSFVYICDHRGRVQKYKYLIPINLNLLESFTLETNKPIETLSCFGLSLNYIITYEKNSDYIMIHDYQGKLKNKIEFAYKPKQILTSFDNEDWWICDDIRRVCISFRLDNSSHLQKLELIQYDDVQPVRLYRNKSQFFIHDSRCSNSKPAEAAQDHLLIFDSLNPCEKRPDSISLDFIKNESNFQTDRLYHPIMDDDGFLIIKHLPDINDFLHGEELVVIDMNDPKQLVVLNRIELNNVFGIDLTVDNRLIIGIGRLPEKSNKLLIF